MKLYSNDYAKNKTILIGNIIGKTLHKTVENRKHFMRAQNGYGISEDGLEEAKKRGVETIRIVETDTGQKFEVSLTDWVGKGSRANYGHGQQVFLPMKYYKLIKPEPSEPEFTVDGRLKMLEAWKKLKGGGQKKLW